MVGKPGVLHVPSDDSVCVCACVCVCDVYICVCVMCTSA